MSAKFWTSYWLIVAATWTAAGLMLALYTPTEATMGVIQKIFYLHLPAAVNTLAACALVFVASAGYLWQRRVWWDDLAAAAATVAVLGASLVLITGIIWGRVAWGAWWTWSPRLTSSLALWLLYAVYMILRASVEGPQRRALLAAVYGLSAFFDVPLVYLSARLIPDPIHPTAVDLAAPMKLTLTAWFVPVTAAMAGLIVGRYSLTRRQRALTQAQAPGQNTPAQAIRQGVAV